MNVYKNLLFLQGHFVDPYMDAGYGPDYGNQVANARARRESWQPAHAARAASPGDAGRDERGQPATDPATAQDGCRG